jgi:hypothetical protein
MHFVDSWKNKLLVGFRVQEKEKCKFLLTNSMIELTFRKIKGKCFLLGIAGKHVWFGLSKLRCLVHIQVKTEWNNELNLSWKGYMSI